MGLVSYIYFLIYELFSPYIEVAGMVTTALAMALGVLNVSFMVLYMGIYVAYSSILSLTAFFARVHTIDLKLTFSDVCKAVGLCLLEVSCLRFVLAWVRVTALGGGKKRKRGWGEIERKQIHFSTTGAKQEQPRQK